jgi:hypothetical protein
MAETIRNSRPSQSHRFQFIIISNKNMTEAQTREMEDKTAATKFEQHTTAHPTVHLPPHWGSTWRD